MNRLNMYAKLGFVCAAIAVLGTVSWRYGNWLVMPAYYRIIGEHNPPPSFTDVNYFWVIDKVNADSVSAHFSGVNFWNGYILSLFRYHDPELAKHMYLQEKKAIMRSPHRPENMLVVQHQANIWFRGHLQDDRDTMITEIHALKDSCVITLTQLSGNEKYRTPKAADAAIHDLIR